jgi:bacillithiol system protein YtxJ
MNWIQLETSEQLGNIKKQSENATVLIFKHSTRCSTSRMALDRLERTWDQHEMKAIIPYYLDLITYRQISNQIADNFGIEHESPQVLLISNGQAFLNLSHFAIQYDDIKKAIKN